VYSANPISYHIAKKYIQIRYIGLPNIVCDSPIVPELIQDDVNPKKIIKTILNYLDNPTEYNKMKQDLLEVGNLLGKKSASNGVAEIMIQLLTK
jgi:lipid-A-disaccharide synthase